MADETPASPPPVSPQTVPHTPAIAIWSLILAVLSFTCGWLFTAVPAVLCGHVARTKIRKSAGALGGKGIATAGLILGYIALVLGILGIPLLVSMIQSDHERLQRLSTKRKEIASDDSKIKISVPGTWGKMTDLNNWASLQVGDTRNRTYLFVITEAKGDGPEMTLQTYHQHARDETLKHFQALGSEPISLTIDGHPALQDELSGTDKGTSVAILHTTVDDGGHFQTITTWTTASGWQQQKELLREITRTFHSENQP